MEEVKDTDVKASPSTIEDTSNDRLKSRKFLLSLVGVVLIAAGFLAAPLYVSETLWDKYVQIYDKGSNFILVILGVYFGYNLGAKSKT